MFKLKYTTNGEHHDPHMTKQILAHGIEVLHTKREIRVHTLSQFNQTSYVTVECEHCRDITIDGEPVTFYTVVDDPAFEGEEPKLDQPHTLANTDDRYDCVCVSTGHLTPTDLQEVLPRLSVETGMVMQRDTGFFVKLFEDPDYYAPAAPGGEWNKFRLLSAECLTILRDAHSAGYRMVEFDSDADLYTCYPEFDH